MGTSDLLEIYTRARGRSPSVSVYISGKSQVPMLRLVIKTGIETGNETKRNEISLHSSRGQSLYYAQLHYNICTQYLFMHQARLQVADFSARCLSIIRGSGDYTIEKFCAWVGEPLIVP